MGQTVDPPIMRGRAPTRPDPTLGHAAHGQPHGTRLFTAPAEVCTGAPSWGVPGMVNTGYDTGAAWLDGLDITPNGALVGPAHPPQRIGPPLLVHAHGTGQHIGTVHMVGAHALFAMPTADGHARWAPVLAQPTPWTREWDGYTVRFQGALWESEDGIAITDGGGADVPLAIFQRRHGHEPLQAMARERMAALAHDAARVFDQHPSWPGVRADIEQAPPQGEDSLVWAPWSPGDPLLPLERRLMEGLERVARMATTFLPEAPTGTGTEAIFLAGHWPRQDGTLSPMSLGSTGGAAYLSTRYRKDPQRTAFFVDALKALRTAGLLDGLARRPWLHTPKVQAARVLIPAQPPSAHTRMADLAWAQAHGWDPRTTPDAGDHAL